MRREEEEKKKKRKASRALDEGGRERDPLVEEGEESFFAARVFVGEGEWGVCPKGEWWSLGDGGTVVAVAEQRGVTWGYTTWGPGPRRAPGWRRRKCAAYIRPGIDGNQHPVRSWTHPEYRESKNENPGTSAAP